MSAMTPSTNQSDLQTDGQDSTPSRSSWLKIVKLPAGSGKTRQIQQRLTNYSQNNPSDNILAITYTNRAVDELKKGFQQNPHVDASTIHSFIEHQLNPLLTSPKVVEEYFTWRGNDIERYINDPNKKATVDKYEEQFGKVSFDSIKARTTKIRYSRRQFGSMLYSSLSHDDLLNFFVLLAKKYRMVRQRIGEKYQLIIIDECQDTDPDILSILADIADEFSTPLWLYGDLMQQIFNKQESKLQSVLERFTLEQQPIINYRSRPRIVDMLNKLSNDISLRQSWNNNEYPMNDVSEDQDSILELIISDNPKQTVDSIQANTVGKRPLALVVFNKERFEQYELTDLFNAYSDSKQYGYISEYSLADVLLPDTCDESVDDLDSYILQLIRISKTPEQDMANAAFNLLSEKKSVSLFGNRLRALTNNSTSHLTHSDLISVMNDMKKLTEIISGGETIEKLLQCAAAKGLINRSWYEQLLAGDKIYDTVKSVSCSQFVKQYEIIENPDEQCASTQHGVKGESHESVIFVTEDSTRNEPRLSMYDCVEIISTTDDFNLAYVQEYQRKCYELAEKYFHSIEPISKKDVFMQCYQQNKQVCQDFANDMRQLFQTNNNLDRQFYEVALSKTIDPFLDRCNVGSCNKTILGRMGAIDSIFSRLMTAFRILYVGCSRAKSELRIVMEREQLINRGCEEAVASKFQALGFSLKNE